MKKGIEITKALAGYTRISYNGEEIAKHNLSATTQGTREAFEIPEEESVISWLENHFVDEIKAIDEATEETLMYELGEQKPNSNMHPIFEKIAMVYVSLKTPKSISSEAVKSEIQSLIKSGKKTNEIGLKMDFITTDKIEKEISDKFQVLKNKIAFEVRG